MKNFLNVFVKHRDNSKRPVNTGRMLKHAVFIGIIVISLIFVIVSKLQKPEEIVPDVEEPIESYDKITEIEIVFDEETMSETTTDIENSANQE